MIQAMVARNFYRACFSHKATMGLTWWNTVDGGGYAGEPEVSGLLTKDMEMKPVYDVLDELINHEWKTKCTEKVNGGRVAFRGFRGKYRLSWNCRECGQRHSRHVVLTGSGVDESSGVWTNVLCRPTALSFRVDGMEVSLASGETMLDLKTLYPNEVVKGRDGKRWATVEFDIVAPHDGKFVLEMHNDYYGALRIDESAADAKAETNRVDEAAAAFGKRYAALAGRIEALDAKLILRIPTPYNEFGEGTATPVKGRDDSHRRVSDVIRAFAREKGLPFVDDYARMSKSLAEGEAVISGDRIHPNDYGQWRMAESLLDAQGLRIAPFRPQGEVAAESGLAEWFAQSQKLANVLSAEWLLVRDETLDVAAKLAKVREWLVTKGANPGANPFVTGLARRYLDDKPREDAIRAAAEAAWDASGNARVTLSSTAAAGMVVGVLDADPDAGVFARSAPCRNRTRHHGVVRSRRDNPSLLPCEWIRRRLSGIQVSESEGERRGYSCT